jgi:hypothetical protein
MAAPNVTLDGDELTVEIAKGNKQWVARLDGKDEQYGYDREFVSPYGRGTERTVVGTGAVLEMCYHSHGGREKGRRYWVVVAGELVEIDESEVDRVLDATVVRIDDESERETHECEECGDEFDSEHGLAVHKGIKHSDDEETEDITGDPAITESDPGGPSPTAMTDGGAVADGGDETDWELVAGDEPSRNGTRRIVTGDEARTPYTDSSTFRDELLGIDMKIGGQYSGDTIQYVSIQPQIPRRARGATGADWLCRLAVDQGDYDDLYGDGAADDPLPGYQRETTGDYRQADPEDPRGDGVYVRDDADSPLTAEIADVVTREGGRIPVDFAAAVQNEGYARSRDWTVYAPAYNPHHVAAAVTDLLRDTDGVSEVRVHVSDTPASRIARELRANGIGHTFDAYGDAAEESQTERALRELRWASGLSGGRRRLLEVVPTEARERVQEADFDDLIADYEPQLRTLHRHPGDAWDYHEVSIHIDEDADDPYYG